MWCPAPGSRLPAPGSRLPPDYWTTCQHRLLLMKKQCFLPKNTVHLKNKQAFCCLMQRLFRKLHTGPDYDRNPYFGKKGLPGKTIFLQAAFWRAGQETQKSFLLQAEQEDRNTVLYEKGTKRRSATAGFWQHLSVIACSSWRKRCSSAQPTGVLRLDAKTIQKVIHRPALRPQFRHQAEGFPGKTMLRQTRFWRAEQ